MALIHDDQIEEISREVFKKPRSLLIARYRLVGTLSEPLQGAQWFASFMVRPDEAKAHVKFLLPPYPTP
jgi:hypothetical protein